MMMLMMRVWHVRVPVLEAAMPMGVRVGLARRILGTMCVLMMRVMHMRVRVRKHFVLMLVLVIFGEMQPNANRHQGAGNK